MLRGQAKRQECEPDLRRISDGPRSPDPGCREFVTSGMSYGIEVSCLVILTSEPFRHVSRYDGEENTVVSNYAGFHGYMLKLDFMILSNTPRVLYSK